MDLPASGHALGILRVQNGSVIDESGSVLDEGTKFTCLVHPLRWLLLLCLSIWWSMSLEFTENTAAGSKHQ